MKIILTETFLKDYKKLLGNYNIDEFVSKIRNGLLKNKIFLSRPFLKLRFNIDNLAVRLVCKYVEEKQLLICIFIFKKWDKKYWFNLRWETIKSLIPTRLKKINNDLINGKFKVYK